MIMSTDSVTNTGMEMAGVEITDFYQQYRQPLLVYLSRIVQDRDTAEELCQDSFVKVVQHWRKRNQQQDVRAWLYRIAKNTAFDQLRRQRRRPSVPLSETWDIVDEQSDVERQVSEAVAIRIALAQLPTHERVALTMQLYEDRKLNEIATATGTPVNTVKTLLRRARAHFQAVYQE
jgi:RNA polymerase sigma factor (sigma-70 family)